jgi:transposase InsO family protein
LRFRFVDRNTQRYCVTELCRNLEVSKAGYYAWRSRRSSKRADEDLVLVQSIGVLHKASRSTYGSRRIHADLRAKGLYVGRKRVARLMQAHALAGKKRPVRRIERVSSATYPAAPNILERKFNAEQPNRMWVADMTYIATKEGWLYVAIVMDLCGRRVVGWAMASLIDAHLAITALAMALERRGNPTELTVHTDRGSQYASREYRNYLKLRGVTPSMSRKGNCWDNAPMESFFATLKTELDTIVWPSRAEARLAIFDWVETWYNPFRRHSTNRYLSPMDAERQLSVR